MTRVADDVGVIIPVYNRPRLALKTLDSVAKQRVLPGKLVVVDDGSTDNTAKVVQEWIDKLQTPLNATLISTENRGVSAARNRGLKILDQCKYVAFLDSDDLWPESFVERMIQRLNHEPRTVAATCDRLVLNLQNSEEKYCDLAHIEENPITWMLRNGAGIVSCSMFRLKEVLDAGGFNEATLRGEDTELFLRIALIGPWLHETCEPVTITVHNLINGEEGRLDRRYDDMEERQAEIFDSFICGLSVDHPNRSEWQGLVSWRWYRAGRSFQRKKLFAEANSCYRRAVHWKRFRLKNQYRYLTSLVLRNIT